MKLTIAALCEQVRERNDGRLDLVGVFHELNAPGFPAVQDRMTAVFIIEWATDEAGEQPLRADLIGPGGRKVLTIEGHTEVMVSEGATPPRTRLILPLEQVVFPEPGDYIFELLAGGDVSSVCPLRLLQIAAS